MGPALVLLVVVSGSLAVAQPAPAQPSGLGGDLVFGWAGQRGGPDGWVGRYENEVLPVLAASRGAVLGFYMGAEYWRSQADHWGFSLPLTIAGGIRLVPVRAMVGAGFDVVLVDQVADDTGWGLGAPFAMARVGGDVRGFQLGVDARVGYRWQVGAPDHTRWQLGVFVGKTWATKGPLL